MEKENITLETDEREEPIGQPNYGELIIEMVHSVNDEWVLEQIYRCVKNITKED